MLEVWDLWLPDVGATGVSFARSQVDDQAAGNGLLVHAAQPHWKVLAHAILARRCSGRAKLAFGPTVCPTG